MNALKRKPRPRKSARRNLQVTEPQPVNPIVITSAGANGNVLSVQFDQVISLHGLPDFTVNVTGATPLSVNQEAPNLIEITYSAVVDAATQINVPFRDPAIRSANGGYVIGSSFVIT